VALLCTAACLWAGTAAAEVRLAPAADGHLGAWLVSGPLGMKPAVAADPVAGSRWRLIAAGDGALNLDRELDAKGKAGPHALLGGVLEIAEDFDGFFLLSADGGIAVSVDGQTIFDRDLPRLRDQSWDAIPVKLRAGSHPLVLRLHHRGRHWAAEVRVVDRRTWLPPPGLSLRLPGTTDRDAAALVLRLQTVAISAGVDGDGYHPRCVIEYRRGVPRDTPLDVTVEAHLAGQSDPLLRVALGSVVVGPARVQPFSALLPTIAPDRLSQATRVAFEVRTGAAKQKVDAGVSARAPALIARARAALVALADRTDLLDRDATAATLAWRIGRLQQANPDRVGREIDDLSHLIAGLERGGDPFRETGVLDLALPSDLDHRPQPLRLHVPQSYAASDERRYPLVVLLHGYDGSPAGIMEAFLDTDSRSPHPGVDGFVLAPAAHGNAFYRGPGEQAVMAAVDFVLRTYPIDPDRVSITGVSMGGTGAAHLGLRYAERFAAAAPLCGYQSYFVRRDVQGRPRRPWETDLMHHWSPASFAQSGRHLPLYVAHGTRDLPLSNSRVLVDAYRTLGYPIVDDWPDTGHAVWKQTYAGARLWPWLVRHRRDPGAPRITLRTDALRYGKLDWVRIVALAEPGRMGQVDAELVGSTEVRVTTERVAELEIDRPTPVAVTLDGVRLAFDSGERVAARRDADTWIKAGPAAAAARTKRAGLEGPVSDALLGPLLFVYGSRDPAWARASREVAQSLANLRFGVDVAYPVLADLELTPELARDHSLVLVGNPSTNQAMAALDARLPIRVTPECVELAARRYCGDEVGAMFIYPNPDHPDRYVVLVEAPKLPGLLRALSLPQLVPDFLVFDAGVAASAGEQVLASGHVLAGGFFQNDWSLPPTLDDPGAPAGRPPVAP
jgi:predicted esterase